MRPAAPRMPHKALSRPVHHVIFAPIDRILEAPIYSKLAGLLTAAFSVITGDIVFLVLIGLAFCNAWDFIMGREAAKRRGEPVNSDTARAGALTKFSGIVLVLIVRLLEAWGTRFDISVLSSTNGAIAAGFCVTLILFDLESIEGHRVELGARPIPMLSQLMSVMRKVEGKLLSAISSPPPYAPPPSVEDTGAAPGKD